MEDKIKMAAVVVVCMVIMQMAGVPTLIEQANSPETRSSPWARPLLLFFGTVLDMRFYIPAGLIGGVGYLACRSRVFRRL